MSTTRTMPPNHPSQGQPPPPPSSSKVPRKHRKWITFESLKNENTRRRTFKGWPVAFLNPEELAHAGFFYLKKRDYVECAFCRGVVGEWEEGDKPFEEHKKHFSWCPFVLGLPVGNTGDAESEEENDEELELDVAHLGRGYDTCQRFVTERRPHSAPERANSMYKNVQLKNGTRMDPEALGLIPARRGPRFPEFISLESRLSSFKEWPSEMKQTPEMMAEAGFFYAGLSDHVKCFSCGGGLRNWDSEDDPWKEHAYWFFRCAYVTHVKGKDYIKSIRGEEGIPEIVRRPVTLEMCMNSSMVKKVQDMGFDRPLIRHVVGKRLEEQGRMFGSVGSLAGALLDEEDRLEREALTPAAREAATPAESTAESHETTNGASQGERKSPESGYNSLEEQANGIASALQVTVEKTPAPESMVTVAPVEVCATNGEEGCPQLKSISTSEVKDEDANTCKVCLDEVLGVAFMPCGHLCGVRCAPALSTCPICRSPIHATFRIYM